MNPPRGVRDTGGSRRGDLPSTKTFKAPRRLATGKNKSASIPLVWFRSLGTRISSAAEGVVSLNSGKLLHHSFIEINDTALDLLENKGRGQDFRYGSKRNPVSSCIGAPVTTFATPWATMVWSPSW